jgi:hypothetical protein
MNDALVREDVVCENLVRESLVRESLVRENLVRESLVRESLVRENLVRESLVRESLVRESLVDAVRLIQRDGLASPVRAVAAHSHRPQSHLPPPNRRHMLDAACALGAVVQACACPPFLKRSARQNPMQDRSMQDRNSCKTETRARQKLVQDRTPCTNLLDSALHRFGCRPSLRAERSK